jgi:hypothetical protein
MDFFLALFVLRAFRFLFTISHKHKIYPFQKHNLYYSPPLLSFSILSLLFHFSFIYLPVVFATYFSPFPSLSFRRMCSIVPQSSRYLLHLLSSPSVLFLFSLSSFSPLKLVIIHFSLSHTFSPPYCTSILLFSLISLTYPCLCSSTLLFTFSLYIYSPGHLFLLSFF